MKDSTHSHEINMTFVCIHYRPQIIRAKVFLDFSISSLRIFFFPIHKRFCEDLHGHRLHVSQDGYEWGRPNTSVHGIMSQGQKAGHPFASKDSGWNADRLYFKMPVLASVRWVSRWESLLPSLMIWVWSPKPTWLKVRTNSYKFYSHLHAYTWHMDTHTCKIN